MMPSRMTWNLLSLSVRMGKSWCYLDVDNRGRGYVIESYRYRVLHP